MALSLGVTQSSKIKVGDHTLTVQSIVDGVSIGVTFKGAKFIITEKERTEICQDVFLSCGGHKEGSPVKRSRLAFEAPLNVKITRLN